MNLVGKIFVGIIALMSVVCLTLSVVSYASHHNWKEQAAKLDEQVKAAQAEKSALSAQKTELENKIVAEKDAYMKTIAALKTENDRLTVDIATIQKENVDLNDKIDNYLTAVKANQAVVDDQRTQIDALSSDLAAAQESRSSNLRALAQTTQKLHETSVINGDLQSQNQELTQAFDDAQTVLNQHGLTGDPAQYGDRPKFDVKGTIEAVKEGPEGLVMISIGSDDGLSEHNKLDVSRGDAYLGQIEVVTVEPNRAVCKVTPGYRLGTMMEGDNVSAQSFN